MRPPAVPPSTTAHSAPAGASAAGAAAASGVWRTLSQVLSREGPLPTLISLAVDAALLVGCWHLGYLFRMGVERWQPARPWYDDYALMAVVCAHLGVLLMAGVYRLPRRYAGFADFARISAACLGVGVVTGVVIVQSGLAGIARSVLVLHPLFAILALTFSRMLVRMVWEHAQRQLHPPTLHTWRQAVVLGGGGSVAELMARLHTPKGTPSGWQVLGIFDDHLSPGHVVEGARVLGGLPDLAGHGSVARAGYVLVAVSPAGHVAEARAMAAAYATGKTVIRLGDAPALSGGGDTDGPSGSTALPARAG